MGPSKTKKKSASKFPSGAQKRKATREREKEERARERERSGLDSEWDKLLKDVGPPPLDAVANSEWANNFAAAMAWVIAKDKSIPLEERTKRTAEMIDRIGYTHAKAVTAKRVREVKEDAGIPSGKVQRHADGIIQVGTGDALRAGAGTRGGSAVSGSVPELPEQGDGRGTASGGRPVGPDDEPVH